jgi:hypothetical protein
VLASLAFAPGCHISRLWRFVSNYPKPNGALLYYAGEQQFVFDLLEAATVLSLVIYPGILRAFESRQSLIE